METSIDIDLSFHMKKIQNNIITNNQKSKVPSYSKSVDFTFKNSDLNNTFCKIQLLSKKISSSYSYKNIQNLFKYYTETSIKEKDSPDIFKDKICNKSIDDSEKKYFLFNPINASIIVNNIEDSENAVLNINYIDENESFSMSSPSKNSKKISNSNLSCSIYNKMINNLSCSSSSINKFKNLKRKNNKDVNNSNSYSNFSYHSDTVSLQNDSNIKNKNLDKIISDADSADSEVEEEMQIFNKKTDIFLFSKPHVNNKETKLENQEKEFKFSMNINSKTDFFSIGMYKPQS